jgi:peroxiredoxin
MFDGSKVAVSKLRGKVILINFWATWCPPCRKELARVEKDIIERFKNDKFVFLPISREESYEVLQKFRENTNYTFPMGLDPGRKIYSLFADQTIPRNYLIDKTGKIVKIGIGYDEKEFDSLVKEIENTLKRK